MPRFDDSAAVNLDRGGTIVGFDDAATADLDSEQIVPVGDLEVDGSDVSSLETAAVADVDLNDRAFGTEDGCDQSKDCCGIYLTPP